MRLLLVLAACASTQAPVVEPEPPPPRQQIDPTTIDVPDPPDLPEVPVVPAVECAVWDDKNPACRNDPRNMCGHGAYCRCPSPPDVELEACWAVMPCPSPPDRRVHACARFFPRGGDTDLVLGRILKTEIGDGVIIVISVGEDEGITKTWRANVLRDDTGDRLSGGEATIIRVGKHSTVAKVRLTIDQLRDNTRVLFAPN